MPRDSPVTRPQEERHLLVAGHRAQRVHQEQENGHSREDAAEVKRRSRLHLSESLTAVDVGGRSRDDVT